MNISYFFQRLHKGYSDKELWDLGPNLVLHAYPRLKDFQAMPRSGSPAGCSGRDQWERYLDHMILAFELWILDEMECAFYPPLNEEETREIWDNIHYGFKLFGAYMLSLWD